MLLGSEEVTCNVMCKVCVLLECFTVGSEVLYKEGNFSDFNGISCDILRSARDQMVRMITMVSFTVFITAALLFYKISSCQEEPD